jgi:phage-related tail protein
VEDWQQWQIRADQIAAALEEEVGELERDFLTQSGETNFRAFWPKFRDLKDRVRTAPAIRLEAKLALERRLRDIGSRAYKRQESAYAESQTRRAELLSAVEGLRASAEGMESPKELRGLRRQLDGVRAKFESGLSLMPPDRQAVWEAWKEASQFVWQRLTSHWEANEAYLRQILDQARRQVEQGNPSGARQAVARFFDALKGREARQSALVEMRNEATELRAHANQLEERRAAERAASRQVEAGARIEEWKSELERNREAVGRLGEEVATLEEQYQQTRSILEQAMLRGTLVEKRTKLAELERAGRALEQRIEGAEEAPLMPAG